MLITCIYIMLHVYNLSIGNHSSSMWKLNIAFSLFLHSHLIMTEYSQFYCEYQYTFKNYFNLMCQKNYTIVQLNCQPHEI